MERNPASPKHLDHDDIDAIMAAADVGCFATYIMKQGGVLIPRNQYLVRTAYETADEANDYGEFPQRIYGICAPSLGERYTICTHPDEWKLVKKKQHQTTARARVLTFMATPSPLGLVAITVPGMKKQTITDQKTGRTPDD